MKIKKFKLISLFLIQILHLMGLFTYVSFRQTLLQMIDYESKINNYEFLVRSAMIFSLCSFNTFILLFNKRNDFYFIQLYRQTYTFRLCFDPKYGNVLFFCHVLGFIFGLFILYARYRITINNMGKLLIQKIINIFNDGHNINHDYDKHPLLKHCDEITLENLNKINQIGELFMRFGSIIFGIILLTYLLAFIYFLNVIPQSNFSIIFMDSMILTTALVGGKAIITAANCIVFFYMIQLTYFRYRFIYWNKLLKRIYQQKTNFISPKWNQLLLHTFLQNHNSMIICFIIGYSTIFLVPIHIIMLDLMIFHYKQFTLLNLLLIIIYVFNISILTPIFFAWLPMRVHLSIYEMHHTLYSLLAMKNQNRKYTIQPTISLRFYLKLQTYTQRLISNHKQIGIHIGPFCVTHYNAWQVCIYKFIIFFFIK
ncbi:hypothetical protein DERP_014091 [Dermatophagoides pteronyssinus]|uniref:Gustatory receptor n=1 Tax=Dermatophagoides pteronyssinus TaxID=6956 RepID=A0ABQ8J6B4_DERPT|nr:hypothetical protein DERP_014091 [Dermatophagoides pteronyssinus]